ncbi:MAG: TlpA disulfide reductase family protein, partial [Flavobacteriales bacterium]
DLEFDSIPLQDHIHVRTSDENKRLWEYKYISRETQAVASAVYQQELQLDPSDTVQLAALDSLGKRAADRKTHYLNELTARALSSYFSKVIQADAAVVNSSGKGPMAVALAFDFSDPSLMRSSSYDKAVMAFLRNLNAIDEDQFSAAADTLMDLADKNVECHAYMLDHLVDIFSTYGPEAALQHVIDRYVAPAGDSSSIDPALRKKVAALLKVSVGGKGPEERMDDRGTIVPLSNIVKASTYTALFFYSSTCSHCEAQMPTLKTDYEHYRAKGFQVVGIALDADSADFLTSIKENAIPWKCYSHFIGWGEPAAKDYMVKATPTFYLLDPRMLIVAKPTDAEELGKKLKELLP